MRPTEFAKNPESNRYTGLVTNPCKERNILARTLYVGGGAMDDGCIWLQIGSNDEDIGLEDPNPCGGEDRPIVYMSIEDAQGLVIELLDHIRRTREEMEGADV